MKPVLAFTLGADHPSSRFRIAAYANHFSRLGWDLRLHHFDAGMGKSFSQAESGWKHAVHRLRRHWRGMKATTALRKLSPTEPVIISRELPVSRAPFLNAPNPIILDVDDALYLGSGRERLLELCRRAQIVVCGNQILAGELSKFPRRCVVIPTAIDTAGYRVRENHKLNGSFRLGWLGSSMSLEQTLLPFMDVLAEIRREIPFELVVISDEPPKFLRSVGWSHFLKWSPTAEKSIANLMDAGIMPLQDNPYQRAKCGAKLLQYMAAGLPVIATPLGVNRELVVGGVNGFGATNPDDWRQAIQQLATDETLRATFGQAGRKFVAENYSIPRWAERWVALLNELQPD